MPPPQPWGHSQGLPPGAGSAYGGNPQFMPSRPHDSFYPPDLPPLEKQPHHGISMYGQNAPTAGIHSGANQQPPSMISQVVFHDPCLKTLSFFFQCHLLFHTIILMVSTDYTAYANSTFLC